MCIDLRIAIGDKWGGHIPGFLVFIIVFLCLCDALCGRLSVSIRGLSVLLVLSVHFVPVIFAS